MNPSDPPTQQPSGKPGPLNLLCQILFWGNIIFIFGIIVIGSLSFAVRPEAFIRETLTAYSSLQITVFLLTISVPFFAVATVIRLHKLSNGPFLLGTLYLVIYSTLYLGFLLASFKFPQTPMAFLTSVMLILGPSILFSALNRPPYQHRWISVLDYSIRSIALGINYYVILIFSLIILTFFSYDIYGIYVFSKNFDRIYGITIAVSLMVVFTFLVLQVTAAFMITTKDWLRGTQQIRTLLRPRQFYIVLGSCAALILFVFGISSWDYTSKHLTTLIDEKPSFSEPLDEYFDWSQEVAANEDALKAIFNKSHIEKNSVVISIIDYTVESWSLIYDESESNVRSIMKTVFRPYLYAPPYSPDELRDQHVALFDTRIDQPHHDEDPVIIGDISQTITTTPIGDGSFAKITITDQISYLNSVMDAYPGYVDFIPYRFSLPPDAVIIDYRYGNNLELSSMPILRLSVADNIPDEINRRRITFLEQIGPSQYQISFGTNSNLKFTEPASYTYITGVTTKGYGLPQVEIIEERNATYRVTRTDAEISQDTTHSAAPSEINPCEDAFVMTRPSATEGVNTHIVSHTANPATARVFSCNPETGVTAYTALSNTSIAIIIDRSTSNNNSPLLEELATILEETDLASQNRIDLYFYEKEGLSRSYSIDELTPSRLRELSLYGQNGDEWDTYSPFWNRSERYTATLYLTDRSSFPPRNATISDVPGTTMYYVYQNGFPMVGSELFFDLTHYQKQVHFTSTISQALNHQALWRAVDQSNANQKTLFVDEYRSIVQLPEDDTVFGFGDETTISQVPLEINNQLVQPPLGETTDTPAQTPTSSASPDLMPYLRYAEIIEEYRQISPPYNDPTIVGSVSRQAAALGIVTPTNSLFTVIPDEDRGSLRLSVYESPIDHESENFTFFSKSMGYNPNYYHLFSFFMMVLIALPGLVLGGALLLTRRKTKTPER